MSKTSLTTRKLYNLGIAALFLVSLFAPMIGAQGGGGNQTGAPTVTITDADLTTSITQIFGEGHAYVVATLAARDISDERDTLRGVTATVGTQTIKFDLLETGARTGRFTGSFGAGDGTTFDPYTDGTAHDVFGHVLANGFLDVAPGTTITIKVPHATGTSTVDKTVKWFPAAAGALGGFENQARDNTQLSTEPILGHTDSVFLRVDDSDRNINAAANTADSVTVIVWSDSEPLGETLTLRESTAAGLTSLDSSLFDGVITFEEALGANNQKLFVRTGDQVHASYADPRDATGAPQLTILSWDFFSLTDATVTWSSETASGLGMPIGQGGRERVVLKLFDPDLDTVVGPDPLIVGIGETPTVDIFRDNALVCDNVPLTQGGTASGYYWATFMFLEDAPFGATDLTRCIMPGADMMSGASVQLTEAVVVPLSSDESNQVFKAVYSDRTRQGVTTPREATVTWLPGLDGDLVLGEEDTPQLFAGTLTSHDVRLFDLDANLDSDAVDKVTVKVRSTTDPINGISLQLNEVASDAGEFAGTFSFVTGTAPVSSGSALAVKDKDWVMATYDDAVGGTGRVERISSELGVWRAPMTGIVTTDDSQYFYQEQNLWPQSQAHSLDPEVTNPTDPDASDASHPDTFARVFVEDQDQNDPRFRDEIEVEAVTIFSPSQHSATLTLQEVGINSGLFTGILGFTLTEGDGERLFVGPGDQKFRIEYADAVRATSSASFPTSPELQWRHTGDNAVRVPRLEILERTILPDPVDLTRHQTRNALYIGTTNSGGGKNNEIFDAVLAVYSSASAGSNCPSPDPLIPAPERAPPPTGSKCISVQVWSLACPEPLTFILGDSDANMVDGAAWFLPETGELDENGEPEEVPILDGPDNEIYDDEGDYVGGSVGDGRFAAVMGFKDAARFGCLGPFVGIDTTDTVSISAGPGIMVQMPVRPAAGRGASVLVDDAGKALGGAVIAQSEGLPSHGRVTWAHRDYNRLGRDVIVLHVDTWYDAVGFNMLGIETGVDTGVFSTSWLHRDPPGALPGAATVADEHVIHVISDLQRRNPVTLPDISLADDPTIEPNGLDLSDNTDGVRLTVRSPRETWVSDQPNQQSYQYMDPDQGELSILNSPTGTQSSVQVRLDGNDVLTGRIFGEELVSTHARQVAFPVSQAFVPGSEIAWQVVTGENPGDPDQGEFIDSCDPNNVDENDPTTAADACSGSPELTGHIHRVEAADPDFTGGFPAAEPIYDMDRNGRFGQSYGADCGGDMTYTPSTKDQGANELDDFAGCDFITLDGLVAYHCTDCGPGPTGDRDSVDYQYRLAFNPAAGSVYQYSRLDAQTIRLGANLCDVPADPTDPEGPNLCDPVTDPVLGSQIADPPLTGSFFLDYTPARVPVIVVSPTETETVDLLWDNELGAYIGDIAVEQFRTPNNDKIHVTGLTTPITIRYDDPATLLGTAAPKITDHFQAIVAQTLWRAGSDPAITFALPDFSAPISEQAYGSAVPLAVTDQDGNRNPLAEDGILIRASDGRNANEFIDVVIRETGLNTGLFAGYVPVESDASPDSASALELDPAGATLVARYNDAFGLTGRPNVPLVSIPWLPASNGAITLITGNEGGATATDDNTIFGADGALRVRIVDPDANRQTRATDSIQAIVKSESDLEGVTVTLTEQTPGVFISSPLKLESNKVSGNTLLFARSDAFGRDDIWVEYFDRNTAAGRDQTLRSTLTEPNVQWRRTFDGLVNVEQTAVTGLRSDCAINAYAEAPADYLKPICTGVRNRMTVTIQEGDCNFAPNEVDTIPPAAGEASDFCPLTAPFSLRTGATSVSLAGHEFIETGANTGEFVAAFSFGTLAITADRLNVPAANGDMVRLTWTDPRPLSGLAINSPFFDEIKWNQVGVGTVTFDQLVYNVESATATITVVDAISGLSATTQDTVKVRVTSSADPTGVEITLRESQNPGTTGFNTGVFTGSVRLDPTASGSGAIKVNKVDTVRGFYTDANPAGTREGSAAVNVLDKIAPVTTLTPDVAAAGANGVFLEVPKIGFTATDATGIREIGYKIGTSSAFILYDGVPFALPGQGAWTITYRAIDLAGNEEAPKVQVVEIDLADPTQTPANLKGEPLSGGRVKLTWDPVPESVDPFEFFSYIVLRDAIATPVATQPGVEFIDATLTDESAHSYRVGIIDKAGRQGPLTAPVSVVPDRTLPTLAAPTVSPAAFDNRALPSGGVDVGVTVTDASIKNVTAAIKTPGGVELANITLTKGDAGRWTGNLAVDTITQACQCVVEFTAIDEAGNIAKITTPLLITGRDTIAPDVDISADDNRLEIGTPLVVTVQDDVAIGVVSYRLDDGPSTVVGVEAGKTKLEFEIPASLLSLGVHKLTVEAADNATELNGTLNPNRVLREFTFVVVGEGEGEVDLPASFFLRTTATPRSDGSVLVEWDVPADVTGFAGFQVWRAASPFALVSNVNDPEARSYVDNSAEPGSVYTYVVTLFFGAPFENLGQVPGYPGSDDAVAASAPVTAREGDGRPWWLWWLIGILAICAVAILIGVAIASRRGGEQQTVMQTAPPPPPPEAETTPATAPESAQPSWNETHRIRCPQCSHRFEVSGTKPIVTNCPNCGRKGILR